VAAEPQQAGMALKQLDAPLTGKVILKCKLQYANPEPTAPTTAIFRLGQCGRGAVGEVRVATRR
jgi:hypothetical protein